MKKSIFFSLLAGAALLCGCATEYKFGTTLAPELCDVYVPTVLNESGQPEAARHLTRELHKEIRREGTLLEDQLDALLLGNRYAESLGVNLRHTRNSLLLIAGLLTATVTAFCGPIGFIGLVVPHIARLLLNSSSHSILLPCTMLAGAVVALMCQLVSVLPASGMIPINAITPIVGVPIIIYIILNRNKIKYFN